MSRFNPLRNLAIVASLFSTTLARHCYHHLFVIFMYCLTTLLDHLEHVIGPCWCFWAGPHQEVFLLLDESFSLSSLIAGDLMDAIVPPSIIPIVALIFEEFLLPTGKKRKNLPPSLPSIPIIGHLHLLKQPIHRTLENLSTIYGPIVFLRFGSRSVILVSSPSLAEQCFTKNDINFVNRPPFLYGKHLHYNFTTVASEQCDARKAANWCFSCTDISMQNSRGTHTTNHPNYGDHWRNFCHICAIEIFSSSGIRRDEIKQLARRLQQVSSNGFSKLITCSNAAYFVLLVAAYYVIMESISWLKNSNRSLGAVEEDLLLSCMQIKTHKELKTKKSKAKACLFAADFELQKMKESETIKMYLDRLLGIAHKVRLLGSDFSDSRIVEKLLVTEPERYEATITTLENTKDLSRFLWQTAKKEVLRANILLSSLQQGRTPPFKCWRRPDAKCSKCNLLGHGAMICRGKTQQQQQQQEMAAQVAEQEDEDKFFVASCFQRQVVLYVPEINQNLLSVGQLIERGLKVIFEEGCCQILDANREEILKPVFQTEEEEEAEPWQADLKDDLPIRGTRLIQDIYQRCNVAVCEPADYLEAVKMKSAEGNGRGLSMIEIWELVDRPQNRKGYAQIFGVDYSDRFAPVARLDTISLVFALAAQNGWKVFQLDVKSAFLNGSLHEEIYVDQPEGFAEQDLGLMSYFLGMEIKQEENEVFICQWKYAKEILKKFHMEDCKFMHCASENHLKTAKRVIRYIKGTVAFAWDQEFFHGVQRSSKLWHSQLLRLNVAATATTNQASFMGGLRISRSNISFERSAEGSEISLITAN
uniref:Reverse transcriptase Ty1/copia-type domain-containing protein n=1 Tax=Salix viminalis TaxID=40686 RepID=A0A6N2ML41_SALVM